MRIPEIEMLLKDTITKMGFELWGVELLPQGRYSVLRVFIDSENGINVDDCAKVSHQVSAILDVEDPIQSTYTLEVSSPGLNRPLFMPEQYRHYCGDSIKLWLKAPIEGTQKVKGILSSVGENGISLEAEIGEFSVTFDNIQKAQVDPQF